MYINGLKLDAASLITQSTNISITAISFTVCGIDIFLVFIHPENVLTTGVEKMSPAIIINTVRGVRRLRRSAVF